MSYKFNPFTGNLDAAGSDVDLASPGPIGGTTPDAGTFNQLNIKATSSAATLGDELVTNGTFTGNADGWTLGQNWAYGSNNVVLTLDAATEGTLSQTIPGIESGALYLVSWMQTHSVANNGTIQAKLGSVSSKDIGFGVTGNKAVSVIITAGASGTLDLVFTPKQNTGGSGTITIDGVSISKLAQMPAISLDYSSDGVLRGESRIAGGNHGFIYGLNSFRANISGTLNIAVGFESLRDNTTATLNIAIGTRALAKNTKGIGNTAIGYNALLENIAGDQNIAIGESSLEGNVSGGENTVVGRRGLFNCTTGYFNAVFGNRAGLTETTANGLTTASYCTFVGAYSGPGSTNQYDYATAIGAYAKVTSANTVVLGRTTDATVIGATGADGSNALLQVTGSTKFTGQYINAATKTLTESSDTAIVDIAVAAGTVATGEFIFGIEANDATDYQTLRGRARYAVVNKAGTLTVDLTVIEESKAVSAGTLTATCTATSGTNKITLNLNAVSSLTQTTLRALWRIEHEGGVITAL